MAWYTSSSSIILSRRHSQSTQRSVERVHTLSETMLEVTHKHTHTQTPHTQDRSSEMLYNVQHPSFLIDDANEGPSYCYGRSFTFDVPPLLWYDNDKHSAWIPSAREVISNSTLQLLAAKIASAACLVLFFFVFVFWNALCPLNQCAHLSINKAGPIPAPSGSVVCIAERESENDCSHHQHCFHLSHLFLYWIK